MVVHDAQVVHVEIVQPVELVYVLKGNHTPRINQITKAAKVIFLWNYNTAVKEENLFTKNFTSTILRSLY